MHLSTRSRYGLRALAALAGGGSGAGCCAREIAEAEGLSKKYLEAILARLRAAGFVRSVRGAHGGYVLARDPREIRVGDVVRVLEGSLALVGCVEDRSRCDRARACPTRRVWVGAEQAVARALDAISIADLRDGAGAEDLGSP